MNFRSYDFGFYRLTIDAGTFQGSLATSVQFYYKRHLLHQESYSYSIGEEALEGFVFIMENLNRVSFDKLPLWVNNPDTLFRTLVLGRLSIGD